MNVFSKLEEISVLFYKLAGARCNCENSKCAHEPGGCSNSADSGKVLDIGSVCDECLVNFSPEYVVNNSKEPTEEEWKAWEEEQYQRWVNYSEDELIKIITQGQIRDYKHVLEWPLEEFENQESAKKEKEIAQNYFNSKKTIDINIIEENNQFKVLVNGRPTASGKTPRDALIWTCVVYYN